MKIVGRPEAYNATIGSHLIEISRQRCQNVEKGLYILTETRHRPLVIGRLGERLKEVKINLEVFRPVNDGRQIYMMIAQG